MDLSTTFSDSEGQQTEPLLLTDLAYSVESTGYRIDTPVIQARCRTASGELRILEVEGFRPFFYIPMEEFRSNPLGVLNDRRVLGVEAQFNPADWKDDLDLELPDGDIVATLNEVGNADVFHVEDSLSVQSLEDEDLVKIIATTPGAVGGGRGSAPLCEHFETTFEADIPFLRRFLISSGIHRGLSAPTATDTVRFENWDGESDSPHCVQDIEPCDAPDVEARVCTVDIEVATFGGAFPEPHRAKNPITAIGAHDSYTDEYQLWGLVHEDWEFDDLQLLGDAIKCQTDERFDVDVDDVQFFEHETDLLESFHAWFLERDCDIVTGWNSDGFDVPYLIQRSYNQNALAIREWAVLGNPGVWAEEHNGETKTGYSVQGRSTLDMFDAYTKTQYRALDSYKLEDVATAELGFGKVDLEGGELDAAWSDHPVEFFVYNVRDVQAVVEIERSVGLMELYENMREVTGALYETCNNNGPMLDTLFLRRAYDQNLALPTNEEPDENVYHGAKVFPPVPGVHRNCVYPDLSSMYPNLFAMLNLGSETIIGTFEDLEESEYTPADCYKFPVDNRPFATVPKGEPIDDIDRDQYKGVKSEQGGVREMFDAQYDWLWVLKPGVKESFVRDTIDELIELKYQYTGGMYEAVKRVTNSTYGVMGDSESGGKGFRLYDRRVAEGITLAGRMTITFTANMFTKYLESNYDDEALLIGGDTDSCVTSIPSAPSMKTAREWAEEAVDYVEQGYDDFVMDAFAFDAGDEHRLAVELESLASTLFFMEGDSSSEYVQADNGFIKRETEQSAVRKRYAQHIVWDDDDGWLDTPDGDDYPGDVLEDSADLSEIKHLETITYDEYADGGPLEDQDPQGNVGIKGFEYVRSDSAQVTRDSQLRVLTDILLAPDPRDRIEPYLQALVDDVESGNVSLDVLARPKGISQPLSEYGWKDVEELDDDEITDEVEHAGGKYRATPGPGYRGAKYADEYFSWEDLGPGSKPKKIPIEKVRGDDYPGVYRYETYPDDDNWPDSPEVGREVDAIAVENPERLPSDFIVDYSLIVEKEIEDKLTPILATIDLDWDDLLATGRQATLGDW